MKKLTRKQYKKLYRKRSNGYGDITSAYDLNEVGGLAHDQRIKNQVR